MTFGLSDTTLEKIRAVFAHYPEVDRVIIYGSRAIGTHKQGSDIDLTVMGSHLTDAHLQQIALELDALNLPYLFDLSLFHMLDNASFLEHIHRVGQLLYVKAD